MTRLFRTLIFVALAFWAGQLYERVITGEKCRDAGGYMRSGLCRNLD